MVAMFTGTSAHKLLEGLADSISLSVSSHFHNKENNAPDKWSAQREQDDNEWAFAADFHPVAITQWALVELIRAGKAFSVANLKNSYRNAANFIDAQIIGVDLDGLSVGQARKNAFIREYAFYVYATPSNHVRNEHNPDGLPMSRALFWLDRAITNPAQYSAHVRRLLAHLNIPEADEACTGAVQLFFGSTYAKGDDSFQADKVLPVAVLEGLASVDTSQTPVETTPPNVENLQDYQAWLETNSRRIADRLGVTGYDSGGYSNLISCPCGEHNNNDANPSAAWNRDKHFLKCHTTKRTYTIKQVAAFLTIDLANFKAYRPGLHNSTREALLKAKYHTLARFLEVFYMNENTPGWYDLDGLRRACDGLTLADSTLRSMGLLDTVLLSAHGVVDIKDKKEKGSGLFYAVFRINCIQDISFVSVENDVNKSIRIPHAPQLQSGRGRPKTLYYVPSEQDFATLLNIELIGRDWLCLADVQSAKRYCETLNKSLLSRRPGQYDNQWLGNRIGRTSRTIRTYISSDSTIAKTPQHRVLGRVDNVMLIPSENDNTPGAKMWRGKRFLQVIHSGTGELIRYSYTRENAAKLLRFGHVVNVCVHEANHYQVLDSAVQPETMPKTVANPHQAQPIEPAAIVANMHQNNPKNRPYSAAVADDFEAMLQDFAAESGGLIEIHNDTRKDIAS